MDGHVEFLSGEYLYLRPVEAADLERCRSWMNDPEVRRFVCAQWPVDEIGQRQWFDKLDRGWSRRDVTFAIVLRDGDRLIGTLGLHGIDWRNRRATTGTLIGEKDCWGRGYGSEAKRLLLGYAFDTLGLRRIDSEVLANNPRSLACQKKCGYVEEGRRRQAILVDGVWVDVIIIGLLSDEWCAASAKK